MNVCVIVPCSPSARPCFHLSQLSNALTEVFPSLKSVLQISGMLPFCLQWAESHVGVSHVCCGAIIVCSVHLLLRAEVRTEGVNSFEYAPQGK